MYDFNNNNNLAAGRFTQRSTSTYRKLFITSRNLLSAIQFEVCHSGCSITGTISLFIIHCRTVLF